MLDHMKVTDTASFYFAFFPKKEKEDISARLKTFLADSDWLDDYGRKRPPLNTYHTEQNGTCYVVLARDYHDDFLDHVDEFFDDLVKNPEIQYVKVIKNKSTDKIVYNNVDRYPQIFAVEDIKNGDLVLVHLKKVTSALIR